MYLTSLLGILSLYTREISIYFPKALFSYTMLNPFYQWIADCLTIHSSKLHFPLLRACITKTVSPMSCIVLRLSLEHSVSIHGEDSISGCKLPFCLWLPVFLCSHTSPHLAFSNLAEILSGFLSTAFMASSGICLR